MNFRVVSSFFLLLLLACSSVHAQTIVGNGNGSGNTGTGNGNGNGNGNANGNGNGNANGNNNGSNDTTTASGGNSSVTFNGKRNTPSVVAPGLAAAGIETCLGSTSVGGSGPGFGLTVAGTHKDRDCNLRLYSRTLYSMGHKVAALQILCNDPDVAAALALEGVRCLVGPAALAESRNFAGARAEVMRAETTERPPCRNWVLFRGCLDEPEPVAQAASTPAPAESPSQASPQARRRITTAYNRPAVQ